MNDEYRKGYVRGLLSGTVLVVLFVVFVLWLREVGV